MSRADLTGRLVAKLHAEEAIVAGIGFTNFDLWSVGRRPQNFYMLGSMGLALPIALGVAIAPAGRAACSRSRATARCSCSWACSARSRSRRPKNLAMIVLGEVCRSATMAATHGHRRGCRPRRHRPSLGLCRAATGRRTRRISRNWSTRRWSPTRLCSSPRGSTGDRPAATTDRDPVQIRESFMRGLGVRRDPFQA